MHDSIEDARSALNLYKAYHDFEDQGIFDQKLEELYKEGRLYVGDVLLCSLITSDIQSRTSNPLHLRIPHMRWIP